jgi:ABC-type Fe3+/spermidine/putrescine transport system ATPase subunit
MIKIEALSKSFNGKKVIENLNFEIQKKEIVALLGPNGSGKSTLLNLISGILQPDSGNICINNKMVYGCDGVKRVNVKPFEREIGYVFQDRALFPHMRVQDNISYGLKSLHLSKFEVRKRTNKLLEFVNLTEHALSYPNQLSGGQQQLAALARSLAIEPQVILLDEPVSTVDPQFRETFRLELKKYLQTLEITTIYVTHNFNEAFTIADKTAVMGNGHIEQVGDRAEIFDKTQSVFVAKFLGMNIFKGRATKEQNNHLQIETNNNNITLLAASNFNLLGKNVTITIKPEDITISTKKPDTPNATINNILGVITEMAQMRSTTQITVDIGCLVKAKMAYTAAKNLGVTVGDKIYIVFNPSKVNVFSEKLST